MRLLAGSLRAVVAIALMAAPALAEVKVGITLSITGPAAARGTIEKNVFDLLPDTLAGEPIVYLILDDASDPTTAIKNARRLTGEDKVDILLGSTTAPNSLAISLIAAEAKTPLISMSSAVALVEPMDDIRRWVFKSAPNDSIMIDAVVEHMKNHGVKTVGYIGLGDATGDGFLRAFKPMADRSGLKIVATEFYNRADQSAANQVARLVAAKPDAVFVGAFGVFAAVPQIELVQRGYKGKIYHTHGVADRDFLRIVGASAEGVYLPSGPLLIAKQLPDSHPAKKIGVEIAARYEAKYGAGTVDPLISNAYDAVLLLENALPAALKLAKPGTPEFRTALRDALEATKNMAGTNGVYTMSASDHVGLDSRSRSVIRIVGGAWTLAD